MTTIVIIKIEVCDVCGLDLQWEDCYSCGGQGYFDLYDEDPVWYDVDDYETCDICEGKGGYLVCPGLPHREDGNLSAVQAVASGIALAALRQAHESGKDISVPSLGIVIPGKRMDDTEPAS